MIKSKGTYVKIYKNQNGRCFYCNEEFDMGIMEKEHVFPKSKGGRGIANKVLACTHCNRLKGSLLLSEFREKIRLLLRDTEDKSLKSRYKNIIRVVNRLERGVVIRGSWHQMANYKFIEFDKVPVK